MNSKQIRSLVLALLLMFCVQLIVYVQLQGPRPKPSDAPPEEFSAARAFAVLQLGGPYKRPVYFLFTDGEEAGMLGASAFAGVHSLANEKCLPWEPPQWRCCRWDRVVALWFRW